jgi:hypothetical protein
MYSELGDGARVALLKQGGRGAEALCAQTDLNLRAVIGGIF